MTKNINLKVQTTHFTLNYWLSGERETERERERERERESDPVHKIPHVFP